MVEYIANLLGGEIYLSYKVGTFKVNMKRLWFQLIGLSNLTLGHHPPPRDTVRYTIIYGRWYILQG